MSLLPVFGSPPGTANHWLRDIVGNEHILIFLYYYTDGIVPNHYGVFHIYCRYRNRWLEPIPLPFGTMFNTKLLGFADSHVIQILVNRHVSNELALLRLSKDLTLLTIVRRKKLAGERHTSLLYAFTHNRPWFLIAQEGSDIVTLYEVENCEAVKKANIDIGRNCQFSTVYGNKLFFVCPRYPDFLTLKSYDIQREVITTVARLNFPVIRYGVMLRNCNSALDNLLIVGGMERPLLYVYDLSSGQLIRETRRLEFMTDMKMLATGELIMFDGGIASIWFRPPSLAEITLRVLHANMPMNTSELLRSSSVNDSVKLVQFLVGDVACFNSKYSD